MRVLQTLALPLGYVTMLLYIICDFFEKVHTYFRFQCPHFRVGIEFGAGYEARTRYLHLGKVALYRMSYTRILIPTEPESWCLRSESNQRHADFQSAALPTELQRHIVESLRSPQKLYGDPERTRTVDLQRDRLAC